MLNPLSRAGLSRSIRSSAVLLSILCLPLAASAGDLTIEVSGVVGSGTTNWEFSGTSAGFSTPTYSQADGAVSLGSNLYVGRLNNFQGSDFTSGDFGTFDKQNVALSSGATIVGESSGTHTLEGFTFRADPKRFTWFADGSFPGSETLSFYGIASAGFEIGLIDGIDMFGDTATVTALTTNLGSLTINFTTLEPIPEPSTALLIGLGLTALAARRRRSANH